jgi:hypothetical protein
MLWRPVWRLRGRQKAHSSGEHTPPRLLTVLMLVRWAGLLALLTGALRAVGQATNGRDTMGHLESRHCHDCRYAVCGGNLLRTQRTTALTNYACPMLLWQAWNQLPPISQQLPHRHQHCQALDSTPNQQLRPLASTAAAAAAAAAAAGWQQYGIWLGRCC